MKTRYILNSLLLSCCFTLALFLNACSNEIEFMDSAEQQNIPAENNDINFLQSLGFDISDIIETNECYLVEGDIIFEKDKLSSYGKAQTRQAYHTTGLIAHPKQRAITVGIDNSIPTSGTDNWREEILEAINLWNPLSNLKLTYTTDANPDILIRSDINELLPNNAIAAGSWPTNGKPGSTIRINLDYNNNKTIPSLQKVYNMVHELGHCFGLRHTNWESRHETTANHISGTPSSDPYSVMNGGTAEYQWNGFSEGDKDAIRYLYPFFTASFNGFPDHIRNFGEDKFHISITANHPIVSYWWQVGAGYMIDPQGNSIHEDRRSSVTAIFGSPVTSDICVYITTIYGEKYILREDYQTHTFTQTCRD